MDYERGPRYRTQVRVSVTTRGERDRLEPSTARLPSVVRRFGQPHDGDAMNTEVREKRAWVAAGAIGLAITAVPVPATPAAAETPTASPAPSFALCRMGGLEPGSPVSSTYLAARCRPDSPPARVYNDCWRAREFGQVSVFYRYRNGAWRVMDMTTQFWHS